MSSSSMTEEESVANLIKRVRRELAELKQENLFGISINSDEFPENIDDSNDHYHSSRKTAVTPSQWNHWKVQMSGLEGTFWQDIELMLQVHFPHGYPKCPPKVQFQTRVFHPNVYIDGKVCLNILEPQYWNDSCTMLSIIITIQSLLSDPYPDVAVNHDAAKLYMSDKCKYVKTVRDLAKRSNSASTSSSSYSSTLERSSHHGTSSTTFALARIKQDLAEIKQGFLPPGISLDTFNETQLICSGVITGKLGTPFEEDIFRFDVQFTQDYPFVGPTLVFQSRNIFHPNVDRTNGKIGMYLLEAGWTPCVNLAGILNSLHMLLSEPQLDSNHPSSYVLNESAAKLYLEDKGAYEKSVREHIRDDAGGGMIDQLIPIPMKGDVVDQASDKHSYVESARNLVMDSDDDSHTAESSIVTKIIRQEECLSQSSESTFLQGDVKSNSVSCSSSSSSNRRQNPTKKPANSVDPGQLSDTELKEKIQKLSDESRRLEQVIAKIQRNQAASSSAAAPCNRHRKH